MQENGVPDLVGCVKCPACSFARFIGIEAKQPGLDADPVQQLVHRLIAASGGAVTVAHSKSEADAFLDRVQQNRSEPVCAITPDQQFVITPERVAKAKDVLVRSKAKLTNDQALAAWHEVGLGDLLYYSDDGMRLVANLTNLQLVSAAAAIAAIVEGGSQQVAADGLDEL